MLFQCANAAAMRTKNLSETVLIVVMLPKETIASIVTDRCTGHILITKHWHGFVRKKYPAQLSVALLAIAFLSNTTTIMIASTKFLVIITDISPVVEQV